MRILLIHQAFASINEAGGTRHYEMAKYLVSHGHEVVVITSPISYMTGKNKIAQQWMKIEYPENGIKIIRTYTYPALHKSFVHRVFSFFSFMFSSFFAGLRESKIDLVWGTSPPIFQGVTAWLLAFIKRKPFIFEVRDLWPEFAIAVGVLRNKLLIVASYWLEKFLYRNADVLIVNSPGFIKHVTQNGARRVELVANGSDVSMFDFEGFEGTFRINNQLEGKIVFVYAGAHGLSNDLAVVLAAAKLLNEDNRVHFVFVGDGKEKNNLIQTANELNLSNVSWVDPIEKNEIGKFFSEMDAGIAILKPIDLYKTTYPNKVFDYMAAGLPVVLAIDGVIRDVVEEANAGIFVKPGSPEDFAEKIKILIDDPKNLKQLGINGKLYMKQNFDRNLFSGKLLEIMEDANKTYGRKNTDR
ncbi:MAG: glycosyltransferase WbuB [Chloroflexi bacterium HGW-Chloroflexi-10]|nr:MAG: glycosyltransferase WbuB [Chloroflexi bacterium HGW-Chloroflexi-10]